MTTTIVDRHGVVRPDGSLELDQKVDVPPGRVKVRVESVASAATATESLVEFADRLRCELAASGRTFRTKEEIAAELEDLHGDWDRKAIE